MMRFTPCATSSPSHIARDLLTLAIHLVVTFAKLLRPGGVRAVAAESLLLEHQLLNSNRPRQRAPNLTSVDRIVLGFATLFARPHRLPKLGALVKPATLLKFHKALAGRKYWRLFSSCHRRRKPGPKGPSAELIAAIIELKRPNPRFGCIRIAQQVSYAFGIETDKDVVRRVLAKHYRLGDSGTDGPSWLTFIAHAKESLWSADLFRCESILLRRHWVLVVMDECTRCIVGFGVEHAAIKGASVCRMFNCAIAGERLPKHLGTDHDPLFRFHRWLANLRVLEIDEIKSVPYAPISDPFVERLIGTIRRAYLDRVFFWNAVDPARSLEACRDYYNVQRVHRALAGTTPAQRADAHRSAPAAMDHYGWQRRCRGLFQFRSLLDYDFATDTLPTHRLSLLGKKSSLSVG